MLGFRGSVAFSAVSGEMSVAVPYFVESTGLCVDFRFSLKVIALIENYLLHQMSVKGSIAQLGWVQIPGRPLTALCPWTSYVTSLSLCCFFTCKIGVKWYLTRDSVRIYFVFFFFFFFLVFLGLHLRHMEVPRLGVELEL